MTIPPEVAGELDQAGSIHEGWRTQLGCVRVADSSEHDPVKALLVAELDPGEAAAIALAHRIDSKLLIVDDMAGRRVARRLGLTVIGTVGVILTAGERRLIDDPYAVLEELRTRGGLWLSDSFLTSLRTAWKRGS